MRSLKTSQKINQRVLIAPRGTGIRCGWSAVAGQAQSAYVRGVLDMEDSVVGHSVL